MSARILGGFLGGFLSAAGILAAGGFVKDLLDARKAALPAGLDGSLGGHLIQPRGNSCLALNDSPLSKGLGDDFKIQL